MWACFDLKIENLFLLIAKCILGSGDIPQAVSEIKSDNWLEVRWTGGGPASDRDSAARKCKDPIGRWSKRVECWDMGLFSNIIWWFSTFQRAGLFCKESHGQAAQATCWQSGNLTDPPTALLFRHQENLYCVKSCDSRLVRCVMYCKILSCRDS